MELLILIIAILVIGSYKKDFTTLIFSGFGFMFYGLMIINSGVVSQPYSVQFGTIALCFGFYVAIRSAIDLITNRKKEVKKDE